MWDFWKRKSTKATPDWLDYYQRLSFKHGNSLISDHVFVVLDCETTGLSAKDEIITIGAVRCTSQEIKLGDALDQKYSFDPTGKAAEIHGELSEKPKKTNEEYLQALASFIGNSVIVGHNISFDIGMINKKLKSSYNQGLKNSVLDTAQLAIRLDPEKYSRVVGGHANLHLDDLCESYNIPIENRHTALGDAFMTALLLQRLLSGLKKRGISKMNELLR